MRGSESVAATRPYTGPAKPPSQPQTHPGAFKNPSYQDRAIFGGRVGMSPLSGQALTKPKRVSSTPKSGGYISYKRFIQYDTIKDATKADSTFGRPGKTRLAKPRSEKGAAEMKASRYASGTSSSKLPRRSKITLTDSSDRTSDTNLSQGEEDRPPLGTRSTTFIVDAQNGFLDSRSLETLHRKIKSRHQARRNTDSSIKPDPDPAAASDSAEHTSLARRDVTPKEVTSSTESHSEERRDREEWQLHQWQTERDSGREGAMNPLREDSLPTRPKSAGQIRYCDTDDSDESSLAGEIEIVDIDKELENDPEPSPYWTQAPPLQVPEVFIQTNQPPDGTPWSLNSSGCYKGGRQQNPQPAPPNQQQQQQRVHIFSPPHPSQSTVHMHLPPRMPRQRHGSGESDFSAFSDFSAYSDTMIKPSPPNERRRFLSEPEILNMGVERMVGTTRLNGGRVRKGGRLVEDPRGENEDTFPFPPSVAPRGRQRLYSDTMEHVLSRYTEMGLREEDSPAGSNGRHSNKVPVTSHHHHVPSTSGHVPSLSGTRGDAVKPPRKLKPILKHPRNETDNSDSLS